ncbi:MAG: hypothetical protein NG747_07480 [Candidatus Brocadia sp.]|nr:hypothetical protein [Candidatus Brocadia sp.]
MELHELLTYLIDAFEKLRIRYFITGSIASMFYGEPRFTNDIDVVADIKEEHIHALLKLFPKDEFYLSEDAMRNAITNKRQCNIIHPTSGLKIDIVIAKGDDFDESRFKRFKRVSPIKKTQTNLASLEDVIIMKMRYYKEGASEKHLRDIASMVKISGDIIDKAYIEFWTNKFNLLEIWNSILHKVYP